MKLEKRYQFTMVAATLLLLNLIQAGTTELLDDESYYWAYSQHLAWGYYDHPPMIAWMISAGYSLFHNTIGVRLLSAIAIGATPWIMYRLQQPFHPIRLMCIILCVGAIHFGGFLAVPDAPLVFFSSVFLLTYREFLKKKTTLQALILGVCMAAVFYSKYQGFLLVALCILANLRLLSEKKFWFAISICLVLLLPHFFWQLAHGFPSLQYFISERYSSNSYHFYYTTDYILGQLFFFGPLIGWMILSAAYRQKLNGDVWIRTLKFIVCGVTIFFLLSSFRGHTEPNWTAVAIIPGILLLHYYLDKAPKLDRVLYRLLPFSLAIIFFIRIAMIFDFVGDTVAINKELHNNKVWTSQISEKARGYPVYFINSYQQASKYLYYQHGPATSYNGVGYRNNQYDFWKPETKWFDDSILVVSAERAHVSADSIQTSQGKLYCKMFVNPNVSPAYSFYKQMPARKILVPFLGRRQ